MDDDFGGYGGTYAFQQARSDSERNALLDILRGNYPMQVGFPMIPGASGQVGYAVTPGASGQVGYAVNPPDPRANRLNRYRRPMRNRLLDYFDVSGMDGDQW